MQQLDHSQVARAFFKEARTDLRSARLLRDGGEYSRTVAACQQAVEKAAKAILALEGIIVMEHQVADRLVVAFPQMKDVREIGRRVKALEWEGTKTRYPLFGRVDLPIWTPSERYSEGDASEAIADAEFVTEAIVTFVKQTYQLEL
ncbi:MAG: HEPN domain-containing protein [Chloroflexi bacterium]|nr:HEPN domain-containing protein [Chloroflexota bacterium]